MTRRILVTAVGCSLLVAACVLTPFARCSIKAKGCNIGVEWLPETDIYIDKNLGMCVMPPEEDK